MKKIITAITLVLATGYAHAQQDTNQLKFDYYPDANVYYNDHAKSYWYYDSTSSQWQSNLQLPPNYSIDSTKKNSFYYNGPDVWKANAAHMKKYSSKSKPPKKSK